MGNSESQYSLQGPRSNSFTLPNRQNHYSLKIRSAKEELSSHHGWWRTGSRGSGIKSKTLTRSCFSQPRTSQSPLMHHYDHVTDGREGTKGTSSRWSSSSRCLDPGGILPSENGHREGLGENGQHGFGRGDCNGHAVFGYRTPERKSRPEELEDHSSPRVLIKSDGSVRVEFSQVSKNSLLPDERGGPVQLLKFSPTSHSLPAPSAAPHGSDREATPEAAKPVSRTSKGSSLSSEGSWYDSPWGTGGELNDDHTALHNGVSQTFPSAQTELFDQQQHGIGITELYRDTSMAATFPSAKDLKLAHEIPFKHRSSFVCVMEEPDVQEFHGVQEYSSFTLPCRKAQAGADDAEKKESVRNRMRRLSDWTGSLTRRKKKSKEPRYKEPIDCFDSGVDGLTADTSSPSQVSSLRGYPKGQSRARSQSQVLPPSSGSVGALHPATDALRQNIYDNFMRELEASQTAAGSGEERGENSAEETESSSQETVGSLEQLDLLFEKEQGVVRRAGWLTFKPLLTVHKDRKLELVARRKWKQYWVTLKGCTLLFYETYGKGSPEQESLPSYALLAEDGIVQAVPEHPKKENVFCLSNAYGDVYLFQATSQTDLENWVTAVHSASASLFAKRHGKEDTLLLLRGQIHSVLQKIDMDGKMKKMAELQLSIVSDSRNRKAIENQIQQWDQNLERFNIDLFRMRCYLASLQGGELPNPKSLLATASRPSKAALGRLGIFSVSSFHALICSRDEATLRKRSLSLSQRSRGRKGVFSSLKGLDKRSRDKRPSASQDCLAMNYCSHSNVCQIFDSAEAEQLSYLPPCSRERLDVLDGYSVAPSEGNCWDRDVGTPTCVYMPDYQAVTVALKSQHTVTDVLKMACKVKNLDPNLHCLRLRKCADDRVEVWTPAAHELVQDLPHDELEVGALTVCTLHMTRPTSTGDFGFAVTGHVDTLRRSRIFVTEVLPDGIAFSEGLRPSDEILVLNGCEVSSLDLALIQTLFSEHMLRLTVRREPPSCRQAAGLPRAHSRQQVLKDYLYRRHRAKSATDVSSVADSSAPAELEHHLQLPLNHRAVQHSKRVCPRSQSAAAQRQTCSRSRTNSNTDVNGAGSVPMAEKMEHNARSCIYLTALIELFLRDRLPAEVLFSFVAMCWFWPDFVKKHNGVFLSSALLVILRMLQDKLSRLLEDVAACMACHSTAQSVETVCTLYHSFQETSGGLMEAHKETDGTLLRPCPRHMSATERLRKVIQELVDTEKSYVKDLSCLFEIYLKPLQKETFLTLDEMESLFGSLPEMLDFQKVFLQTLEERISSSPDFNTLETPVQFKKLLFSLGGSFLYYADHFKLYSGFCANHIKVQKVLERAKTDRAFKEFLDARNPTKQHSSTLESYLIKPVQRVLKYPLLLRELVSLTDTDSEEHYHLSEALKAMEKVASHINEMQKIYEDYGAVFDHLVAEHCGPEKEVTEISMGEFLMHSSVIWLNPFASLGRMKKEPELTVFVFKKAVILVYRENKQAKKKMNIPRSAHSHGDQDLFKFRWLIPLSALQVRLGNTAETNCVWELIHTKSEVEGRPETVFQLCSSTPECKVNTVRVIRSVLRENVRKGMRGTDHTAEKTCKAQLAPTRTPLPSSAKIGSSRASRLWQEPVDDLAKGFSLKPPHADSDGASESSGTPSLTLPSETPPSTNPALRDGVTKESDILGDEDDGFSERLARRDSAPGYIDAQFSELRLEPEGREVDSPEGPSPLRRAHFCPIKRRERGEPSFSRSQGASWSLRQSESTACSVDLNSLLEREFSVQSLASVVNEDCFFDNSVVAARADLEGGEFTLNALP